MSEPNAYVPQKGDSVMGEVEGRPVRGVVLSVKDAAIFVLQARGPYGATEKLRQAAGHLGPHLVQHEVAAADFELVYRPDAAEPAAEPRAAKGKRK